MVCYSTNVDHTKPTQTELCATRKKGISIVKKLKKRALSLPGKLPAPTILANFSLEFWERESAPAELMLLFRIGHFASE